MYNLQVRLHLPMLLPCTAAVLIMVMAFQLRRIEQDRTVKSTILTLASCVSPVNVVLPSRLVAYVAALGPVAAFLPVTDIAILQSRNLDFGLLPIMMFFLAIAVVLVLCCLAWGAVVMFGSLVHKAVVRAAGGVAPTEVVADVAVSTLQRFPTVSCNQLQITNNQKHNTIYDWTSVCKKCLISPASDSRGASCSNCCGHVWVPRPLPWMSRLLLAPLQDVGALDFSHLILTYPIFCVFAFFDTYLSQVRGISGEYCETLCGFERRG